VPGTSPCQDPDTCNEVLDVCSVCGNGAVEEQEQCDDGNTVGSDGCSSGCTVEPGYECPQPGQLCQLLCGNGQLDAGEQCDQGPEQAGDGCTACACDKPIIDFVKDANVSIFSYAGEIIRYNYSLLSSVPVNQLQLTDNRCSPIVCPDPEPLTSTECSCIYTVQQSDLQTDVINNATISVTNALPSCANFSTAKDSHRVDYEPACGNTVRDVFVGQCDAGVCTAFPYDGNACTTNSDCMVEESCDDGNAVSGDGCDALCACEDPCPNGDCISIATGSLCSITFFPVWMQINISTNVSYEYNISLDTLSRQSTNYTCSQSTAQTGFIVYQCVILDIPGSEVNIFNVLFWIYPGVKLIF
jgi:cysteine-rich repeat protein